MGDRRMFAKAIVQSSRFLKMPVSSRELYFQMGMVADDDGVVEAWNVMQITKANEDDLRVLVSKGFVQILDNDELIAYLTDWETNNTIRADRYHEGQYKALKIRVLEMLRPLDNQLTTNCQPSDNQMATEVKLSKDKLSKDKLSKEKEKPVRHQYGEYKHVRLSDAEYERLVGKFGEAKVKEYIQKADEYCQIHGKTYSDYNLTIQNWIKDEQNRSKAKNNSAGNMEGWK